MARSEARLAPIGFDGVQRVVENSMAFKAQLGIGEAAYNSLIAGRTLTDLWQVGATAATGGAIASSTLVAKTFFGTWVSAWGLATAVTPVGWVLGAAAGAGILGWGVLRLWRGYNGSRIDVVPKFINTPLDYLGAALFDLMAGLAILVAREADELDDTEREVIRDYFVSQWGLAPGYVAAALPLIEQSVQDKQIEDVITVLIRFKRTNKDCNYQTMGDGLIAFLQEIAEADGSISPRERAAIAHVKRGLDKGRPWSGKRALALPLAPLAIIRSRLRR